MSADVGTFLELLKNAGLLGVAVFVIVGRLRGWWVEGPTFKKKEEECEHLKEEIQRGREDNLQLWREKVEDAKQSEELARAYLRLRERENGQ